MREGWLEKLRDDPSPEWLVHTAKVFGFTALGVGLVLLGLIIWAIM